MAELHKKLEAIALGMFGPVDIDNLSYSELLEVTEAYDKSEQETEEMRRKAEETLDSLYGASCAYTGVCVQ
jgi:hypothetical protein